MTAPPEASSANEQPRYRAFLSYSHADTPAAARLHRWLETYRIPPRLVGLATPADADLPRSQRTARLQ